ncbi:MAG: hypothetical protein WA702_27370 [Bradyrhizobium sp.]|uniref:hypothetical protein n=1 Tax=Bradyrhizobium sp. TaxID=376 RepID=UPI003C7BBBF0
MNEHLPGAEAERQAEGGERQPEVREDELPIHQHSSASPAFQAEPPPSLLKRNLKDVKSTFAISDSNGSFTDLPVR